MTFLFCLSTVRFGVVQPVSVSAGSNVRRGGMMRLAGRFSLSVYILNEAGERMTGRNDSSHVSHCSSPETSWVEKGKGRSRSTSVSGPVS